MDDSYDSGYVNVISEEELLYIEYDLNEKYVNNKNNKISNDFIEKYYDYMEYNDEKGFLCDYKQCDHFEPIEKDIVRHVIKHLTQELSAKKLCENNTKMNKRKSDDRSESICANNLNNSCEQQNNINVETERETKSFKCERNGCEEVFTEKFQYDEHLSEHVVQELLEGNRNGVQTYASNQLNSEDINKYLEIIQMIDKTQYICKECDFKSNSDTVITRHIRRVHLNLRNYDSDEENELTALEMLGITGHERYRTQEQVRTPVIHLSGKLVARELESIPLNSPATECSDQMKTSFECNSQPMATPMTKSCCNNVNISTNKEDVLLSCKGLGSYRKVKQFVDLKPINGEKRYFCKWKNCTKSYARTQAIARHVNLRHFGFKFKCTKPDCDKVYRDPNVWRTHLKNHICGFGIYGNQRMITSEVCRNENLNKYVAKNIEDGQKAYSCKWDGCSFKTFHRGVRRHIHNQHVCPYKINLRFGQNKAKLIKQLATNGVSVNSSQNHKLFACRRVECNAKFSNSSDLLKHQNFLCKYKKIKSNSNKQIIKQNNLRHQTKFQNKHHNRDSNRDKGLNSKNETKTKNNGKISVNKKLTILKVMNTSNESDGQMDFDQYIEMKRIDSEEFYFCKWKECKHYENTAKDITKHISETHIQFYCNIDDCTKSFRTKELLSVHKNNHICGFGIMGRKPKGVCDLENVRKYRKERKVGHNYVYLCGISGCHFQNESKNTALSHIHNRHICPNRQNPSHRDSGDHNPNQLSSNSGINSPKNKVESQTKLECYVENCCKTFPTEELLRIHSNNHICGFGIKERKPIGVCDIENIKKYRNEKKNGNKIVYSCKWSGCGFETESSNIALCHIHNRHICPNRFRPIVIPKTPKNTNSNQSCSKSNTNTNKGRYTCKRAKCQSVFNKKSELIKHENFICKYSYNKYDLPNIKKSKRFDSKSSKESSFASSQSMDELSKYFKTVDKHSKPYYYCLFPNCDKEYSTPSKGNMCRHIRIHCGEKTSECRFEGCGLSFTTSDNRGRHEKTYH